MSCKSGKKYDSLAIDKSKKLNLWSNTKTGWKQFVRKKQTSIQINSGEIQSWAPAPDQTIPLHANLLPWGWATARGSSAVFLGKGFQGTHQQKRCEVQSQQ